MDRTPQTNGTPAEESAGVSLIARIRKGTNHSTVCNWPGAPDEKFRICVLHCDQLQDAQAAAFARFEKIGLELTLYTSDDFYSELSMQLLFRAMRVNFPDEPDRLDVPMFRNVDKFRALLEPDERTILSTDYIENQQHSNPDPAKMNPETIELLRQAVKKKDVVILSAFGSATLASYIIGMAAQPSS